MNDIRPVSESRGVQKLERHVTNWPAGLCMLEAESMTIVRHEHDSPVLRVTPDFIARNSVFASHHRLDERAYRGAGP